MRRITCSCEFTHCGQIGTGLGWRRLPPETLYVRRDSFLNLFVPDA
jgi:hypothetical protein